MKTGNTPMTYRGTAIGQVRLARLRNVSPV